MPSNSAIDHGRAFDWGRASSDYAKYRDIYPDEFFERIVGEGLCVAGQDVLDLGTGTGVLPRHMAKYGARFTGADVAENQIAEARRMSAELGLNIDYVVSPTETLGLPDASFDVVTACQCFFYFDLKTAVPNIHRMLKNGGSLLILYMNWLPDESEIAKKTEELVLKYNPLWSGAGWKRKPSYTPPALLEYFEPVSAGSFDIDVPFTRESWHGRIRACRGVGASSLPPDVIADFEREHLAYLETVPPSFTIIHDVNMLHVRKKPL